MIRIAFRNIIRNSHRFLFLGLSISSAFLVVLLLQGLLDGIVKQLDERGARFYGGNVITVGWQQSADREFVPDQEKVREVIRSQGIDDKAITTRTHFLLDSTVFFQGQQQLMRRLIGLDWSKESVWLQKMEVVEGDMASMNDPSTIMISDIVAKKLKAHIGDELTVRIFQQSGVMDTAELKIGVIFHEASIFGFYTAYMDRRVLNKLTGRGLNDATQIGVYLSDPGQASAISRRIHEALGKSLPTYAAFNSQEDYKRDRQNGGLSVFQDSLLIPLAEKYYILKVISDLKKVGQDTLPGSVRYGVLTVQGYLFEIKSFMEAINIVSYTILLLVFIVIAVGISNTYRILMHERVKEIGTMRALGMQRSAVRNLVLSEAVILSGIGMLVGLGSAVIVLSLLSKISFATIPGFDVLLTGGHLQWYLQPSDIVLDALIVGFVAILGALRPALHAEDIHPAEALRAE